MQYLRHTYTKTLFTVNLKLNTRCPVFLFAKHGNLKQAFWQLHVKLRQELYFSDLGFLYLSFIDCFRILHFPGLLTHCRQVLCTALIASVNLIRFNLNLRLHCSICSTVLPVYKSFFDTWLSGIPGKAIYNPGLNQLSLEVVISSFSSCSLSIEM